MMSLTSRYKVPVLIVEDEMQQLWCATNLISKDVKGQVDITQEHIPSQRKSKNIQENILMQIPKIGRKKTQKVLHATKNILGTGSIVNVGLMGVENLQQIDSIGKTLAYNINKALNEDFE